MRKAALVVLTVCLIFPLLAIWAAPPEEPEPAVLAPGVRLPEDLDLLTPEAQRPGRLWYFVRDPRSASPGWVQIETPRQRLTACLAANGGDASICAAAADIARMKPCLAGADDCPAIEAWTHAMGQMGVYPAPQTTTRASTRSAIRIERPEKEKD